MDNNFAAMWQELFRDAQRPALAGKLTYTDLRSTATVNEQDIEAAARLWRTLAPPDMALLLDAQIIGE